MVQADIDALEQRRTNAMLQSDESELNELFDDLLVWVHSSGKVDTKASLISKITSGSSRYLQLERTNVTVREFSDVAVITGDLSLIVELQGERKTANNRYTCVWRLGANPRLLSWQSTSFQI